MMMEIISNPNLLRISPIIGPIPVTFLSIQITWLAANRPIHSTHHQQCGKLVSLSSRSATYQLALDIAKHRK